MAPRARNILLLALLCCAATRQTAHAQFSLPYDPDFAPPEQKESPKPSPRLSEEGAVPPSAPPEPSPVAGQESPAPAPAATQQASEPSPSQAEQAPVSLIIPRDSGPFLLLDRPDPARILIEAPPAPRADEDFADFVARLRVLRADQERWNRMRGHVELGIVPEDLEGPILPLPPEEILASTGIPSPPQPEVELAGYGTSLSIAGRKVIGFQFSEQRFLQDQRATGRPKSVNLVEITQQLQLRMQGKVGPKIAVNVDFDDTKQNKQDISVVYTGDPNEVVQNASFGDIDLSLPSTEFVSYNKQLFGIRADLKYQGFKGTFIGSRTKGTTKSKQFVGNSQFATADILDSSYVRRQHYDLTFGKTTRLPLAAGTERVFLADPNTLSANNNAVTRTADDLAVPSSSFTGTFVQLAPGVDYTVDYVNGILTFKTALQPQFVVAVDFADSSGVQIVNQTPTSTSGGTGLLKLVKTNGDAAISQSTATAALELGFNRELKTVYSVGQSQIVRDDGVGNFILRVLDPHTRQEVGPGLNPVQKYPDTITMDFENGSFRLLQPFGVGVSSPAPDPELYSPTPLSKRVLHLEYHFRLKTFFLEPSLVVQSEVVLIDGVRLNRNVDYFIDYESGFITFFNESRIHPQSVIDVSYEVSPFGGSTSESILGTRIAHEFSKHYAVGGTVLFQGGTKSPTVPNISDLAKNLLILEADTQLKDVWLLPMLKGTLQGEYARSILRPNLSGEALVDNMEGAKQEESTGLLTQFWQIAANPTQGPADPLSQSLINEDVGVLLINPRAPAGNSDTQKTLNLNYDFTVNSSTETSIAFVFSPTGVDMSQKSILEVTMFGDASNNEINFTLGGINEDADGVGGQTLNCADGRTLLGSPKTEDANCDGALQPSEDIGWLYAPVGKNSARFGAGNGRIDTEDLNRNGRLDPQDLTGDSFGYNASSAAHTQLFDVTSGSTRTKIDFGGPQWHTFQIPLDISTATAARWTAIKEIRVSVRKAPAGNPTGTLKFARIAVVGNSWRQGQAGDPKDNSGPKGTEVLTVSAVNSSDNPGYSPIFNAGGDAQDTFNQLYGSLGDLQKQSNSKNVQEQALQLAWTELAAGATVFTKRVFARPIDVSQHRNFNFLLYGNADPNNANTTGEKTFFLRIGSDRNFFEMDIPLTFTGWRRFTAVQQDVNGDQIPDVWALGQGIPGTVIVSTGAPNLQQVSEIVAGVYSSGGTLPTRGAAWLNEIYVSDPIQRVGTAQKLQMDFEVPGWTTFGAKYRMVDHNYQTPTTVVTNQDNRQDAAYFNFTRLAFFPMSFTLNRSIVETPNTNAVGQLSNVVNLLQQGRVVKWNGTATGNLAYGAYPRLSLGYVRDRAEYELLTRLDDRNTYNTALSYSVPVESRFLPRTLDLSFSHSKYSVAFESIQSRLVPGNFDTDEFTNTLGARLSFAPWQGSSFNPSYSLTKVHERRSDFTSGTELRLGYPKSLNQTAGFSSNFRLLSWFNPGINYSVNTIENNILSVSTFVVTSSTFVFGVGDIKTVNRSANGSVSLPINIAEIFPRTRLWRSFSLANGYQLQDGDVWNGVERDLNTQTLLSVRVPLRPSGAVAQRANLTLRDTFNSTQRWSPLEAYGLGGRVAAFKTLAITNNYVYSIQRTETTGTPSKTLSTTLPDVVASLGQLERLLYSDRWMSNGQLNLKYAAHDNRTVGVSLDSDDAVGADLRAIILHRFDTALSANFRDAGHRDLRLDVVTQSSHHEDATLQTTFDVRQFRFTPKVDYAKDTAAQGTGVQTQNLTVITPSLLTRADLALPRGLVLPLLDRPILFTNRIIWTSTLSLAMRSSPVTTADNSRLLNFNTSGDYEIAKNLRMTLNGAFSRLWHKFLREEDFVSYQFGTTLTFQF